MNTGYIDLLHKRIAELDNDDFDLEVWKGSTSLLLTRVFGEDNSYSKEINDLKIDFSSWSLRDATSEYNPKETAKRRGREILELAVAELQFSASEQASGQNFIELFPNNAEKLETAIANKDEEALNSFLSKEGKIKLVQLLTKLLLK